MTGLPGAHGASSSTDRLLVRDLECMRGDRVVVQNLNFEVAAGEVLQIVGPNGSGKTSLLRVLSGLCAPTSGQVLWREQDIHVNAVEWRHNMLFAGHIAGFNPSLTVAENQRFTLSLNACEPVVPLTTALTRVGLAQYSETLTGRLSAGQRQRMMLARLIQIPALVWLLDEPLTALDDAGRCLLETLLIEHATRGGLAVLATHQQLDLGANRNRQYRLGDCKRV